MTCARRIAFTSLTVVMLLGMPTPAEADPFATGDVMRLGFTIPDFVPRAGLRAWNVFELSLGLRRPGLP